MTAPQTKIPDMKKVDAKLRIGILLVALVLLGGIWFYIQYTKMSIPSFQSPPSSMDTSPDSPSLSIEVENDTQAANELANASRGTASTQQSVDDALELLSGK